MNSGSKAILRKCTKCGVSTATEHLSFHKLPLNVDTNRARIWAKFCYPNGDYESRAFVKKLRVSRKVILCSQHFRPSFIRNKRMLPNSFPEEDEELIAYRNLQNTLIEKTPPKRRKKRVVKNPPKKPLKKPVRCCVKDCVKDKPPFHPFPENSQLFEKWKKRVGNPIIDQEPSGKYEVCDAHFNKHNRSLTSNTALLENSIPTINVPGFSGEPCKENSFFYPSQSTAISESQRSSCALCSCNNNHLIPIFEEEGKRNNLATKIHKYLPTKVVEEDMICFTCATTLIAFHNIFKNCKNVTQMMSDDQDTITEDNGRECAETDGQDNVGETAAAITNFEKNLERNDKENLEANQQINLVLSCVKPINICPYNWEELKTIFINNSLRFFTCHLCSVCLPNIKKLQEHLEDCSQSICSKCLVFIGRGPILEDHIEMCHTFACYICPRKYLHKQQLTIHQTRAHSKIVCYLCHQSFVSDSECNRHQMDTHKFVCGSCNNYFECCIEDLQYRRTILPTDQLLCLSCYVVYQNIPKTTEIGINIDASVTNENVTKFFCITCTSTFDTEIELTGHNCITKHDLGQKVDHQYAKVEGILSCTHCTKIFASHQLLQAHISRNHPSEPNFTCFLCTSIFHSESELELHQQNHSSLEKESNSLVPSYGYLTKQTFGDESVTCKYCAKECKTLSKLGYHINYYHRPKKFVCCTICGLLINQIQMTEHNKRKHPKHFKCRLCPEIFETQSERKLHFDQAHDWRKICSHCSSIFKQQEDLNKHLRFCQYKNPQSENAQAI